MKIWISFFKDKVDFSAKKNITSPTRGELKNTGFREDRIDH